MKKKSQWPITNESNFKWANEKKKKLREQNV